MTYSIDIGPISQRTFAVLRFHIRLNEMYTMSNRIAHAFDVVTNHLLNSEAMSVGPAVASYQQFPDGFDVFAGFSVTEPFDDSENIAKLCVGGCETVHTTHTGAYHKLSDAYQAMRKEATIKGKKLSQRQPMWEEYWSDNHSSAVSTRTEIYWPVEPSSMNR